LPKTSRKPNLPKQTFFRFYAELNDLLVAEKRGHSFVHRFAGRVSVKDMIESLGVPHTEIDLILVNGQSADFDYLVRDGDRISVYPVFEALDIAPLLRVRPKPLRTTSFVLDVHLGGLANYLRMLGFDTLYDRHAGDRELAEVAARGRILLTRDRGLLKRNTVTHGYCVRSKRPMDQTVEVLRRFDLVSQINPFVRCLHCNGMLEPVEKEKVEHRLEENTMRSYEEFALCQACDRVYWKGSHYDAMKRQVLAIREKLRGKTDQEK
jgi:uncharacterized protein with PIN domain